MSSVVEITDETLAAALDGATYDQVSQRFGVSRGRVYSPAVRLGRRKHLEFHPHPVTAVRSAASGAGLIRASQAAGVSAASAASPHGIVRPPRA